MAKDKARITAETLLQLNRDTAEGWQNNDIVLEEGEPALLLEGSKPVGIKYGDGKKRWSELELMPLTVDSEYNAESDNPQSGKAVAQAIANIEISGGGGTGTNGKDGVSPTVEVAETANGHNVSITDVNGTKSFEVKDGEDGAKGEKGDQGIQGEKGAKGDKGDKGDTGASGSNGKDGTSVTVSNVTESTADGGSNVVTFSDGKTVTIKNGSKGTKGDKGDTYTLTEEDKTEIVDEVAETINAKDSLPTYWQDHIDEKIATIKALQSAGGRDCCSFVLLADTHYPANLGKCSPLLAKEIMNACNIKNVLYVGDAQTRSCFSTKEEILAENELINEMFEPIKDKMLFVEGNHDGSYATVDGVTYAKQLTETEMFEEYYRRNGLVGDVHFSSECNAYYVDDTANKVRFIGLNAQNVPNSATDVNADGTAVNCKFRTMCFAQSQFDFLTDEALSGLADNWSVVVFAHIGIWRDETDYPDYTAMVDLLTAFQNKSTYSLDYAGTAGGGTVANFTNLFDPKTCQLNTRLSSSGASGSNGYILTNEITIPDGVTGSNFRITFKNAQVVDGASRIWFRTPSASFASPQYVNTCATVGTDENGDTYLEFASDSTWYNHIASGNVFQIAFYNGTGTAVTQADADKIILTINESISYTSAGGWDGLSIDADFTNAKGTLVGYFAGHSHIDSVQTLNDKLKVITTRCDAKEENTEALKNERVKGTITEQSFDVFTINKAERKIYATKIGAGNDRTIAY